MPEYLKTETLTFQEVDHNLNAEVREEKIIPLLEERLIIASKKQKLGEVIVRKEVEIRMIEVPVRREKLIIEQISPTHQQLAEIDLSQGEIYGVDLTTKNANFETDFVVNGEFNSPKIASLILNAIASEENHGCKQIKIAILVENKSQQQKYQEWLK